LGPRAGLDAVANRKKNPINCPYQELKPGRSAPSIISLLTELPWLLTSQKTHSKWIQSLKIISTNVSQNIHIDKLYLFWKVGNISIFIRSHYTAGKVVEINRTDERAATVELRE
jgi:hypothetical protein